jgi:hypothetical protein
VRVDTSGALAGRFLSQISAGGETFTCAVDTGGRAYCWGDNSPGTLCNGSTNSSDIPVPVDTTGALNGKVLSQISSGDEHACALDTSGAAYCWGFNDSGDLGFSGQTRVPVAVDTSGALSGKTLTQISAGAENTCAVDAVGQAFCWGFGLNGALGNGSINSSTAPVAVDTSGALAGKSLAQISTGADHVCAADEADAVFCWGLDTSGQLGNNSTSRSLVPVLVGSLPTGPPGTGGPAAPTGVQALSGDGSAAISWSEPAFAGTITGYTATASPGGRTCTTTATTSCTLTGLTNGTAYGVTIVAHSASGDSPASVTVSVTPSGAASGGGPVFTSSASDSAIYGTAFSYPIAATGSPPPKIVRTGPLPDGVQFTKNADGTGTLSGTPAGSAAGIYPMTLTATNKSGTATQAFTLTVGRIPAIKKISAQSDSAGSPLSVVVTAAGYPAPVFSESGVLPGGISLADHGDGTAVLAGTPHAGTGGKYPITVLATNSSGQSSQSFILTVNEAPGITSANHATATTGHALQFQITGSGFPVPDFTKTGSLPKGISFSGSTGIISGTPAAGTSGTYTVTITARNSSGTGAQSFTLIVQ